MKDYGHQCVPSIRLLLNFSAKNLDSIITDVRMHDEEFTVTTY